KPRGERLHFLSFKDKRQEKRLPCPRLEAAVRAGPCVTGMIRDYTSN
ncbi:hypothetical protein K5549_016156, partial [Capra hircus]